MSKVGKKEKAGIPTDAIAWIEEQEREDPELAAYIEAAKKRMLLGMQIRNKRQEAKLTQKELAIRSKTSQPTIARIEAGDQSNLKVDTLLKLSRALGAELVISFGI